MIYSPVMYQPPKSVEDLFLREEKRTKALAARAKVPEDLLEEFWLDFIHRLVQKGTLSKYDPERGAWATFYFSVVRNAAKHFNKRYSRDPLRSASRLISETSLEEGEEGLTLDMVSFKSSPRDPVGDGVVQKISSQQLREQIEWNLPYTQVPFTFGEWARDILRHLHKREGAETRRVDSEVLLDRFGEFLDRTYLWEGEPKVFFQSLPLSKDLRRVYALLREGKLPCNISQELGMLPSLVSYYKNRIRSQADLFRQVEVC